MTNLEKTKKVDELRAKGMKTAQALKQVRLEKWAYYQNRTKLKLKTKVEVTELPSQPKKTWSRRPKSESKVWAFYGPRSVVSEMMKEIERNA